jgi:hypothetical protein
MPRKLKTYTTPAGFFDLAVAAPSMKAALEAWGSKNNLFHQGFAKMTEDPDIVAATMAKPGVVLRRPVGSNAAFSEHAELPKHFAERVAKTASPRRTVKKSTPPPEAIDDRTACAAALVFEREQERRESERRRKEAQLEKERGRRERAIAAAEAALQEAKRDHQAIVEGIEKERASLDRRLEEEKSRWSNKREKLETALRKVRAT